MSNSDDKKMTKERFGRYLILDHLVDGGMAKICRARFLGEQADKIVAIKMVQPQFSKDESFKTMFIDEIKVTFALLHPNIVQTYDYGLHKGQLFVAMEYCDGQNLKEYLDKLRARKFVFPVEISTYIITQVCQGLNYAHTLTDKLTGKKSSIIHRDISPHNIMLTFDGAVKVIDFGIAKSDSNSESTQAGTIKGKLSYLAPEYLEGLELDPRYDMFAVGITLWEMLCSRKLFKAANDLAVLKKIQECNVPAPSSINPNVPKALDEIVLKALAKDRNQRYENLDQLNRALMKFLYSNYPDFNATDLSYFAKELFKEEIEKDREKLFEFGKIDLKPYLKDLKKEKEEGTNQKDSSSEGLSRSEEGTSLTSTRSREVSYELDEEDKTSSSIELDRQKGKTSKVVAPQKKVESLKINKSSNLNVSAKPKKRRPREDAESFNEKTSTRTRIIKQKSSGGSKKVIIAASIAVALGFGYLKFNEIASVVIPAQVSVDDEKFDEDDLENEVAEDLKVILKNFDKYNQKVFVNGKAAKVNYLGQVQLPINEKVTIRVETNGHRHFVKNIDTASRSMASLEVENTQYISYGYLKTSTSCVKGKLFFKMFGEDRVENLPIARGNGIPFPVTDVAGTNEVKEWSVSFQRIGEDIKHIVKFKIEEDKHVDLCEKLI